MNGCLRTASSLLRLHRLLLLIRADVVINGQQDQFGSDGITATLIEALMASPRIFTTSEVDADGRRRGSRLIPGRAKLAKVGRAPPM